MQSNFLVIYTWIASIWYISRDYKYFPIIAKSLLSQFSPSVCPTLWDPMDCTMPAFPVHHQLLEHAQTHIHQVDDAIQWSHPLLSPSPPTLNLFQHQGLFQWVSSWHQMTEVLELQLQHQSFQWIFILVNYNKYENY